MAPNSMVFKLESSPWDRQAQACIHDKQFELNLFMVGVVCGWGSVHSSKWVWVGFPISSVGVRYGHLELELALL